MSTANQIRSLAEDIEASYGERRAAVSDIAKETRRTLGKFNQEREKMAGDLWDSLSTSERERMKDFPPLMRDIKSAIKAIEKDTANTRAENVKDLKEMAHKLAEFLSSSEKGRLEEFAHLFGEIKESESTRIAEFKEMLKSIQSRQKEREEETAELLSDYQKDLSETKRSWQNLVKVMAAKRAGKSIPGAKTEMGVSVAVKEKAEEAFKEGELKERVLKVVQSHPGGMKLSEIGKTLGVAFVRVAKPIQELLSEVKVKKQDSEYLPS